MEKKEVYWVEFDADKISKSKTGWTINISKENKLNSKHKDLFHSLPGFEIDYSSQLEYQWAVDKKMKDSGVILVGVDKKEVENLDFTGFNTLLKRLTANDEMIKNSRGKLSFVLFGYENDSREVYEIEEVRNWAKHVLPEFKYWGYFLNLDGILAKVSGLMILQLCSVDIKILGPNEEGTGNLVEPDGEQTLKLLHNLFGWLNEFTDKYNIPEEINEEHSRKIAKILVVNLLE